MLATGADSEYNSGPQLLRDIWAFAGIAVVVVILRIFAKFRIAKFGWDDVLMALALLLAIVGSAMATVAVNHGFGRRVGTLEPSVVSLIIEYDYFTQTFGIAGGTLGRVSFIIYIIGLLGVSISHRVILWALVVLQSIVNLVFVLIIFLQCPGHGSGIWKHSGKVRCWSPQVQAYYGYFQGAFNSTTDLYLAVFSTYIFWNLNLKVRVKLGLMTLLGTGVFAMIASIIRTIQTRVLVTTNRDPTIATINLDRWLYIETYLVLITASIPCLRSLVRLIQSQISSTDRYTHELSSPYTGNTLSLSRARNRVSVIGGRGMKRIADGSDTDDENVGTSAHGEFSGSEGIHRQVEISVIVGEEQNTSNV